VLTRSNQKLCDYNGMLRNVLHPSASTYGANRMRFEQVGTA
jgi:hypothetical protein